MAMVMATATAMATVTATAKATQQSTIRGVEVAVVAVVAAGQHNGGGDVSGSLEAAQQRRWQLGSGMAAAAVATAWR